MAREREGYRDVLSAIRERYGHETLSVREAAEFTGYTAQYVTRKFAGWTQKGAHKRIPAVLLAQQLC